MKITVFTPKCKTADVPEVRCCTVAVFTFHSTTHFWNIVGLIVICCNPKLSQPNCCLQSRRVWIHVHLMVEMIQLIIMIGSCRNDHDYRFTTPLSCVYKYTVYRDELSLAVDKLSIIRLLILHWGLPPLYHLLLILQPHLKTNGLMVKIRV